jgi:hypothetical protein
MQKTSLSFAILTTLLVIIFLIQPLTQVIVVEANPFMFGPHIGIVSPQQFVEWNHKYQTIYQTTNIPIQIQINTPLDYPKIIKVYYILDYNHSLNNNPQKTLTISNPQTSTYSGVGSTLYWATGTLKNLSNGTHTVDVWALDAEGHTAKSGTNNFLVNATSIASEQPFAASNLTIALVISIIVIVIGAGLAVFAYKKRKPNQQVKA